MLAGSESASPIHPLPIPNPNPPHALVHVRTAIANVRQGSYLRPVLAEADRPRAPVGSQKLRREGAVDNRRTVLHSSWEQGNRGTGHERFSNELTCGVLSPK